jgi:glc operon protein GlcG
MGKLSGFLWVSAIWTMPAFGQTPVTALPGDMPPPPMAAMVAPPRPAGSPPPAMPDPVEGPSLAVALSAAQAALAQCGKDKLNVGVAVVGSQGNLLVGLTADGARPGRIFSGTRKASAAAAFGVATSVVQERLRAQDSATLAAFKPYMVGMPGAVPLLKNGKVLGAIGVSGATGQQDEACALAGAVAVQGQW